MKNPNVEQFHMKPNYQKKKSNRDHFPIANSYASHNDESHKTHMKTNEAIFKQK